MKDMVVFNTGETSEELNREYNPDGSMLRKAQLRMLDMLLYLDKVCKEQGISYRIDAGNVLGAIRHGGFIPWDDDVDIVLSRKEYRRLCRYLRRNPHPQYKLQSYRTDRGYVGAWSVLRDTKSEYVKEGDRVHNARTFKGMQVDLFPYENRIVKPLYNLSKTVSYKNIQWFVGRKITLARTVYWLQFNLLHPVFRFIGLLAGKKGIYMHGYGAMFTVSHTAGALLPHKPIEFEGHVFPGPANPDLYCREHFGPDYMNLPPRDKRDHHKASYIVED